MLVLMMRMLLGCVCVEVEPSDDDTIQWATQADPAGRADEVAVAEDVPGVLIQRFFPASAAGGGERDAGQ
jgi:hypothetical protein